MATGLPLEQILVTQVLQQERQRADEKADCDNEGLSEAAAPTVVDSLDTVSELPTPSHRRPSPAFQIDTSEAGLRVPLTQAIHSHDGVTAAAASHADGLSGKASGGVQANPPTPAARLVRALTRQASKAGSRHEAEEPSQETEFERQLNDLGEEEIKRKKKFYNRWSFWWYFFPGLVSAALILTAIILRVLNAGQSTIKGFGLWRWFFFSGFCFPVYCIGEGLVLLLMTILSHLFFVTKNALYFIVAVKRPLCRVVQALLLLPLFVIVFNSASEASHAARTAYRTILRVIACLILFTCVSVIKTLAAKLLASHFHSTTHFTKMNQAIKKEYYLQLLAVKRDDTQPMTNTVSSSQPRRMSGFSTMLRKSVDGSDALYPALPLKRAARSLPAASVSLQVTANGLPEESQAAETAGSIGTGQKLGAPAKALHRSVSASTWAQQRAEERAPAPVTAAAGLAAISEDNEPGHLGQAASSLTAARALQAAKSRREVALAAKLHVVEKHVRKHTLYVPLDHRQPQAAGNVTSELQAKRLAFYIFWNVKAYNRSHLLPVDFEDFMPEEQAAEAFSMLDPVGTGKITLDNLRDIVVVVFQERTSLAAQLKDAKTVVGTLQWLLGLILHILFIFFYLLIFDVDVSHTWVLFSSIFLGFSFIFGASIKAAFEAIIFIFVVHPFDVGDCVSLDTEKLKVEEISLTSIVVRRTDGVRQWYPIAKMSTNTLSNLTRSDNKSDKLAWQVDARTPGSVLEDLAARLRAHYDKHSGEFAAPPKVSFTGTGDPLKIQLSVSFELTHNGLDSGRTNRVKSELLVVVASTLTALSVHYSQAPPAAHDSPEHPTVPPELPASKVPM